MAIDFKKKVVLDITQKGGEAARREIDRAYASLGKVIDQSGKAKNAWQQAAEDMRIAFEKATGGLNGIFAGLDKVGKGMAVWNQAFELGGKIVNGVSKAMDAYAKTSAFAAEETAKVRAEFAKYRDDIMAFSGKLAVELLKPAASYDEQYKALLKIGNAPAFKMLYGEGGLGKGGAGGLRREDFTKEQLEFAKRFGVSFADPSALRGIQGIGPALGGVRDEAGKMIHDVADHWDTRGKRAFDALSEGLKGVGKAAKDAKRDVAGPDASLQQALANMTSNADMEKWRAQMAANDAAGSGAVDFNRAKSYLDAAGAGVPEMQKTASDAFRSMIEQDTVAITAFRDAVSSAYGAIVDGSGSATQALKSAAKQQLLAFGVKEAAEAVSQLGYAFGALGNPITAPFAAAHFKSSAEHAAAAAIAGITARVASAGGGGGAVSSASRGSTGAIGGSTGSGSGQGSTVNYYTIIAGDPHSEDSPRMRQRSAQRMIDLAESKTSASRAE